jgi:pyridoxine 4-dehydrogenase
VLSSTPTTTVKLGDTDVARIGLGTNRLTHTADNVALVQAAFAAGVGLVDTAHAYTRGESEETVGSARPSSSGDGIVATKGGWDGASPEVLRAELEESLRKLQTDTIDLYYLHRPDPDTPFEDSLRAIAEFRDSGSVRHVGVSNVTVDQIERARELLPIAAVQNRFSLVDRTHDDVVDYCAREELVFVPYRPLRDVDGGAVADVAERHGATQAQIALAWLLKRSPTMLPIPGTLSAEHLKENVAALQIELSDADFQALT